MKQNKGILLFVKDTMVLLGLDAPHPISYIQAQRTKLSRERPHIVSLAAHTYKPNDISI